VKKEGPTVGQCLDAEIPIADTTLMIMTLKPCPESHLPVSIGTLFTCRRLAFYRVKLEPKSYKAFWRRNRFDIGRLRKEREGRLVSRRVSEEQRLV